MSIRHQADRLSLNRSGLYYVPRGISPEEVAMKHRIDELYTKWPFYVFPTDHAVFAGKTFLSPENGFSDI